VHSVRHLELVRALAKHRHFGRAAEALGISQPALTRALSGLEQRLGVLLFDRANPIRPTVFGEIVLKRSDPVVNGFGEILREIDLVKGVEAGSLSLCVGPYPAEISALDAMGQVSRAHPDLACTLWVKSAPDVAADVLSGRCDLGVADLSDVAAFPELETEALRDSQMHVFCRPGHPLTASPSIALEQGFDYPWVNSGIPDRMHAFLAQGPRRFGYYDAETKRMWPRVRVETCAGMFRTVINSDGLGAAPMFVIADEILEKRLVALPVDLPWLRLNYGFVWARGRSLSPAALTFMQNVREIETRLGN
jgi:DNA-binding transcriptional LysR family regulator